MTRPLLWPFVSVYRLGLALREFQLRSGLMPVRRLRWPVISIGNLSAGGSGKTPLTIALAKALKARGFNVDVLSRGYGRNSVLPLLVDPTGTANEFGDEPLLIAREAQVPVYVAAERYQAGLLAERSATSVAPQNAGEGHRPKAHILDDGFQHRRLARDVDVLLLSQRDIADHLLPAGNLREPLLAAKRAHVIAIPSDEMEVAEHVRSWGWEGELWLLRRCMEIPHFDGPAVAICGIARPGQFFQGLEAAGVNIATRVVFPDHYRYSADDLERIVLATRLAGGRALLTTAKDIVRLAPIAHKLPADLPLRAVELRIEIENQESVMAWLTERLQRY